MSIKGMEKKWKKALFSILEKLEESQYRKLLFNLTEIPQRVKGDKVREEMPQIIVQHIGTEKSINRIDKIMRQIPRMDDEVQDVLRPFVKKIKERRQQNKAVKKKPPPLTPSPTAAKRQKPAAGKKRKRDQEEEEKRPPADRQKSCQPEERLKIGRRRNPKIPKVCSIVEAKKSADRTVVSVEGTVTEVNPAKLVDVKDERKKTQKQCFKLQDETDSIEIFMWGEITKLCKGLSVRDVIKITNMRTNKYYETVSLNSTASTRIHKKVTIEIKRIIKATKKTTHLEAHLNSQLQVFEVTSQRLAKAFGIELDGDFRESLLEKIPLSAEAEIEGGKIQKITAI